MVWFRNVQNEVDGIGACDAGAHTLGEVSDFVGVGGVPFEAFAAVEEDR